MNEATVLNGVLFQLSYVHRMKRWISWRMYRGSPTDRDRSHLNASYNAVLHHLKVMCRLLSKDVARGRSRFSVENLVSRKEWCGVDEVYAAVEQELPHYNRILKAAADGGGLPLAERGLALQFILSAFFRYCTPARPSFYENVTVGDWAKTVQDPERMLRSHSFKTGVCVCAVVCAAALVISPTCLACSCRLW